MPRFGLHAPGPLVLALLSVLAVSLASLGGLLAFGVDEGRARRIAAPFISLAVGALLGDACIHLIPESFAGLGATSATTPALWLLAGFMAFFVFEKMLRRRARPSGVARELVVLNAVGDAIHNYIDGLLIGASYLVSPEIGFTTSLAVLLHEIPQELGDFAILMHAGLSVRQALWVNLASAGAAVGGVLSVQLLERAIDGGAVSRHLMPLTAGAFIYLAAADLVPELQNDRRRLALAQQSGLIALGIAVMLALGAIE
jgi:zinc and cadmium transporter